MRKALLALFLLTLAACSPVGITTMTAPIVVVGVSDYSVTLVDSDNKYSTVGSQYFLFQSLKENYKKGDTLLYFKKK